MRFELSVTIARSPAAVAGMRGHLADELERPTAPRAGTSLLWAHEVEGEALPEVGDIDVVVDHEGEPVAVTRVTSVFVAPFGEVDADHAALEGGGDGSLAHWRAAHWDVFGRECARIGRVPAEDMPVVCCAFELLAVVPASEAGRAP
jgi:uncharacterized protein YhfF